MYCYRVTVFRLVSFPGFGELLEWGLYGGVGGAYLKGGVLEREGVNEIQEIQYVTALVKIRELQAAMETTFFYVLFCFIFVYSSY